MQVLADVPTVGLYVGWAFGVLGALWTIIGIGLTILLWRERASSYGIFDNCRTYAMWGTAIGPLMVVITLAAMWPLDYEYHHYVTKRGVVAQQSSRLLSDGDSGIKQRIVIRDQAGNTFGIDDTRAALLKTGDEFAIKCKREHQWFQEHDADGWACRWGA